MKDLARPMVVALAIILTLVWLLQSLRFLDFIINKGFGLGTFFELTLMLVPRLLEIVWPLAVFAGAVYALRRWQDDNEMVALMGAGLSPTKLLRPLVMVGIAAVGVGLFNSWWLLPTSTTAFKDLQYNLRNEQGHLLLEEGTFNQLGKDMMVYLHRRVGTAAFEGLLVHDTRDGGRPVTWLAKSGVVAMSDHGTPLLQLNDGVRQEVGDGKVEMLQFRSHALDISERFGQDALAPRLKESEEFGWRELRAAAATDPELRAELTKRWVWPLASLVGIFVAAGWLLRSPLPRQSSTKLVAGAVVCDVLLWVALISTFNMAKDGDVNVIYAQWLLVAGVPLLAMAAMKRRS